MTAPDPVAQHHAEILDWLAAALSDPDTVEVVLTQHPDDAGTWTVHTTRQVDPHHEAVAMSRADHDVLHRLTCPTE